VSAAGAPADASTGGGAAPAGAPHDQGAPLKRLLVGRPMRSDAVEETLLRKTLALPIFASDPFSSVAYATEAALLVLVAASATSAHLVFPLSIGVAALLAVVVASYRQTVRAYSTSGGSYVVTRENLGRVPSLVAAAALLTDYVLTRKSLRAQAWPCEQPLCRLRPCTGFRIDPRLRSVSSENVR